jgi:hypothetical protein
MTRGETLNESEANMSEYYDEPTWACPKCGGVVLTVSGISLWTVTPDGAEPSGGDYGGVEWDNDARMSCEAAECDWAGKAGEAAEAATNHRADPDEGDPCADPVDDEGWGGEEE